MKVPSKKTKVIVPKTINVVLDASKGKYKWVDLRWHSVRSNVDINNLIGMKNQVLRDFYSTGDTLNDCDNILIWTIYPTTDVDNESKILDLSPQFEKAVKTTGLVYFTNPLKVENSIDYGDIVIQTGTGLKQLIDVEFINRKAIKNVGYFDVRMGDYCGIIDYANRLSQKGLMPRCGLKKTPWLFDVKNDRIVDPKIEIDNLSSQWYYYKHENLPWEQTIGIEEDLKDELKKIATWNKLKKKSA